MSAQPERIDVSHLPDYAFGHRSTLWWGTGGFIVIEATAFALAVFAYFYLRSKLPAWPPGTAPPGLLWGTINTAILLASAVPNQWAENAAEAQQLGRVRLWLVVCIAFGLAFLAVRGLEFTTQNCAWDSNAYGSIVWAIMGLHTAHLLTDVVDTGVLTAHVHPPRAWAALRRRQRERVLLVLRGAGLATALRRDLLGAPNGLSLDAEAKSSDRP